MILETKFYSVRVPQDYERLPILSVLEFRKISANLQFVDSSGYDSVKKVGGHGSFREGIHHGCLRLDRDTLEIGTLPFFQSLLK